MDSNLFNNPAFANLSPEKLQFLLSFAQKEKPLNMKDAMPFLLSNMRQAKENILTSQSLKSNCCVICCPKTFRLRVRRK